MVDKRITQPEYKELQQQQQQQLLLLLKLQEMEEECKKGQLIVKRMLAEGVVEWFRAEEEHS